MDNKNIKTNSSAGRWIKPQTLKGFRDFLPEEAIIRGEIINIIKAVFERFGYDPLETPALEYAETLIGKYGEEADKLLYTFFDRGERKVGLRYDQTVPTARVVGQYENLAKPFKRYQIQTVWRQEKPQKGRFREFLQCDADIFGNLSPLADSEPIALIIEVLKELGFKKFKVKVNSRNILFSLISNSGILDEKKFTVIQSLDKLDKIGKNGVVTELSSKGIETNKIEKLLAEINNIKPGNELNEIFNYLVTQGVSSDFFEFSPTLARGLDYYTGVIYEGVIENYTAGSVVGGGRYDELVSQFLGKNVPGSGFAFGFDRIVEAIKELNILPTQKTVTKVLVTIFNSTLVSNSLNLATQLRQAKINTEVYLDKNTKLDKQLKYADQKGIPYVIVLGPDEVAKNTVQLKNMNEKTQTEFTMEELIKVLKT